MLCSAAFVFYVCLRFFSAVRQRFALPLLFFFVFCHYFVSGVKAEETQKQPETKAAEQSTAALQKALDVEHILEEARTLRPFLPHALSNVAFHEQKN